MSGVEVSENVPGAAGFAELPQRKVRSAFYSPTTRSALKRQYQERRSIHDVRRKFPPQTVSRTAQATRNAMSRDLTPQAATLLRYPLIAVLIPLKEFETCR